MVLESLEKRNLLVGNLPLSEQSPDGLWSYLAEVPAPAKPNAQNYIQPESFATLKLNAQELKQKLATAPLEFTDEAESSALEMLLPMPNGEFERFAVVEAPIMEPGLAAEFPDIRTYRGQGIDDPAATIRFDVTPAGFHAQVLSPSGAYYIDPYYHLDDSVYLSYFKRDLLRRAEDKNLTFEVVDPRLMSSVDFAATQPFTPKPPSVGAAEAEDPTIVSRNGTQLRTYRLANAATGEYTAFHGGTTALGQAAIVTATNRITGIYEVELAVRLVLVNNNSLLVYTNAATDPYTNSNPSLLLSQNQTNIDTVIGSANYDIGHVYSTGGGGLAALGVVGLAGFKAQGETGSPTPTGDAFWVDYVAHEMGHQFDGNHTFNSSTSSCGGGNRNASTAYEPGSGSTIQAYAGICGSDDLQPNSDPYFHSISFDEILAYITTGVGDSSAVKTATGNSVPRVNASLDYVIPSRTPFTLRGAGTDADAADALTYNWEQRDLGASQSLSAADNGASPLFRSFNATSSPNRTFPRLAELLNNTTPVGEKLPTVARTMKFRATVRDNRSGGGGVNTDDASITVIDTGAGFAVTNPNTAVSWNANSTQTVSWNVAGTTAAPINTSHVNVWLSVNGGLDFTILLAENTPNDGTESIVIPNVTTTSARIKVEAANSIYFDISNANFSITSGTNNPPTVSAITNRLLSANGTTGAIPFVIGDVETPVNNLTVAAASSNFALIPSTGIVLGGTGGNRTISVTPAANQYGQAIVSVMVTDAGGLTTQRNFLVIVEPSVVSSPGLAVTRLDPLKLEGNSGSVSTVFAVDRASNLTGATSVDFAVSGSGAAPANAADFGGTFASGTVSFTAGETRKYVTVNATGDQVYELDEGFAVTLSNPTGGATLVSASATSTILNDDVLGVSLSPTTGLVTSEAGASDSFTIRLTSQPAGNVTIGLDSSNTVEGTVSPTNVVFNAANWNLPQTVTVTGADDFVADGAVGYFALTNSAVSNDAFYNAFNGPDVSVMNSDNDAAGISVSPTSGLVTTEFGGSATFAVRLNSQPVANVTIGLSSSNSTEGTVTPANLIFNASNWSVLQTATVVGADDSVVDGNIGYTILTAPAASLDTNYNGMDSANVTATNFDNDLIGIIVSPSTGLITTEGGGSATFTFELNSQPTGNVTIALSSSDPSEGIVAPANLIFTSANWNVAQSITATGVDDLLADGLVNYQIVTAPAVSSDPVYNGFDGIDITVVNTDDDTPGIVIAPSTGLTTTEAGGTASFVVKLTMQPTGNVTIGLSSNNTTEGTVSPSSLIFNSSNWDTLQTATVTGADDILVDGNVPYQIVTAPATSSDAAYNGINAADVSVTNLNDDLPAVIFSSTSGLVTTEAGGTASFTVRLNAQPTSNVTVGLASSNTSEGTLAVPNVVFTSANWNSFQTITVTGSDDFVVDGPTGYSIITANAASNDSLFSGINVSDVSLTNLDDDVAGVSFSATNGLTTTEAGGTANITIRLTSQPLSAVAINLITNDATEGSNLPTTVMFTPANWNSPQTITITGIDDFVDDGDVLYQIVTSPATSLDPIYSGLDASDISLTNLDDDVAGFVVSATSGLVTTEAGGTATITVRLSSQPSSNVTVALFSSDISEGVNSTSVVSFTPANWNINRTITVTGVNDAMVDGDIAYSVITIPAISNDVSYAGLDAPNFSLTNLDNDVAGVVVGSLGSLTTTEAGGTASVSFSLSSQPSGNVTVSLASSNLNEGTISPSSLIFTAINWSQPQFATITGVNEFIDDGNASYAINVGPATSSDANYNGLVTASISVTNIDNDTAGISVVPTSGLVTTEAGGSDDFTVRLDSQPTSDVTISLASSNIAEGTISTALLVFTPANWNALQTVAVTGMDDFVEDGNVPYSITINPALSGDAGYQGMNAPDVFAINLNDDVAGIKLTPSTGLVTSEAGDSATYTIRLTSQPTANVTVSLYSDDPSEGVVFPITLVFTPADAIIPQTVTVSGVDDLIDDGDVDYSIVAVPTTSNDLSYVNLNAVLQPIKNIDNDTAAVLLSQTTGLVTSEAGATAVFTVQLATQPTGPVTLGIVSNDTTEGTVLPPALVFLPTNWSIAQSVTVTGVDELTDDGDIAYSIVTSSVLSTDPSYNNMNPADVQLINQDDDVAGFAFTPSSGLVTTETGSSATFKVKLTSRPDGNVTLGLASSDVREGTINSTELIFTETTWNVDQTITVTGVDELVDDGDVSYSIITSVTGAGDANYAGIDPADVSLQNINNDVAGIVVSPTSGLVTTEAGGTARFTVKLNSQPTGNVTIGISSNATTEGTVAVSTVSFSPLNWNLFQTITVRGADDQIADGSTNYGIVLAPASSSDSRYAGLDANDVFMVNSDNDVAGVVISPTLGLITSESGNAATFSVRLRSQPVGNVTIGLASSNAGEGTLSTSQLIFTASTWSIAQSVTVSGTDDFSVDGSVKYSIITSAVVSNDPTYSGIDLPDLPVTNTDNDQVGVSLSPITGLTTSESGSSTNFLIKLRSQPKGNVTIGLSSTDTTEGTISPSSVTFSDLDWNVSQTVTITGVNDFGADGTILYSILTAPATSSDPAYAGLNGPDLTVTNADDDTVGIAVSPSNGLITSEAGLVASFSVQLTSQPTGNVTIGLSSSDATEGVANVNQLVFTSTNWNVLQSVTITGQEDSVADGSIGYFIATLPATSTDSAYAGINPADVALQNLDNDVAEILLSPTSGLTTSEAGGVASFSVRLSSQPTGMVRIALTSSDTSEGLVSPAVLSFTSANWNIAQSVSVTGVDDRVIDGNISYTIQTANADGTDPQYFGMNVPDVSVTNIDDNDDYGITVLPSTGLVTAETGTSARFSVRLNAPPKDNVTIGLSSSDSTEGTVLPPSFVFTPASWNLPQTATITGVDDRLMDGNVGYQILTSAAVSSDSAYSGMNVNDVSITNLDDNDYFAITVSPATSTTTTESGATTSFTVKLETQPLSDVTIGISSSDTSEGTVSHSQLVFSSTNWNVPQSITVTGINDSVADGNIGYSISLAPSQSLDAGYNGIDAADIALTNLDDDQAGILFSTTSGLVMSEVNGTGTFSLRLRSEPTSNVTIQVSSSNLEEGDVTPSSLVFNSTNWNVDQTVTVTSIDDDYLDGPTTYRIQFAPTPGGDALYNTISHVDIPVTNLDDEVNVIEFQGTSGLVTSESGSTATFSFRFSYEPRFPVQVFYFEYDDFSEGQVSPAFPVIKKDVWNTITITGVDDAVVDGNVTYSVNFKQNGKPNSLFTLQVTNLDNETPPFPWHNPGNPQDVNADGIIAPDDALLIINEINSRGSYQLPANTPVPFDPPTFFDIDADGYVSPADALLVINFINSRSAGEAENAPILVTAGNSVPSSVPAQLEVLVERKESLAAEETKVAISDSEDSKLPTLLVSIESQRHSRSVDEVLRVFSSQAGLEDFLEIEDLVNLLARDRS